MADALYHFEAARSDEQLQRMQRLERDGVCIFCREHVEAQHPRPVLIDGADWYVTENAFPYAGTLAHYLIVPRAHVTGFEQLPDSAGAELWALRRQLRERHAAASCATVERSGDMRLNGGSIAHLHVHFVVLGDDPSDTVRFRVSAHARA